MHKKFFILFIFCFNVCIYTHEQNPVKLSVYQTEKNHYSVNLYIPSKLIQISKIYAEFTECDITNQIKIYRDANFNKTQYDIFCQNELNTIKIVNLDKNIFQVFANIDTLDGSRRVIFSPNFTEYNFINYKQQNEYLEYLKLGISHLLSGFDHLLFILALSFISLGLISLIKLVTSFTIGHSITLFLSVTNLISLNQSFVEIIIAATLILISYDVWKIKFNPINRPNMTILICFIFGLVHGLGFAGVLKEIGFENSDILAPLLMFNIGIELAQVLLILFFMIFLKFLYKININKYHIAPFVSYFISICGAYWLIERVADVL